MKEQLLRIFNTLKMVETKGDSTLMLADSMRALAQIINEMPKEETEEASPIE